MNTTQGWILVVMLAQGLRVDLGPQPDCVQVAKGWMREARAWEQRSGVAPDAMWACMPPESKYRIERVSR